MNFKQTILLTIGLIVSSVLLQAQKGKTKKEEVFDQKLVCPFELGMGREPKEAYTWDPPDKKVIMVSKQDTAVRSCADAKIYSINPTEDGRFEIVMYSTKYKDYYFWYYGIKSALVNVNQFIKAGQVIGTYAFGQEMEFRMYKDEEPVDPRELLECKPKEEQKQ